MTDISEGDVVEWTLRNNKPPFGRTCRGTVLETNVSKFGRNDILIIDSPTDPNDETYVNEQAVTVIR